MALHLPTAGPVAAPSRAAAARSGAPRSAPRGTPLPDGYKRIRVPAGDPVGQRVEHISTGRRVPMTLLDELQAWVAGDMEEAQLDDLVVQALGVATDVREAVKDAAPALQTVSDVLEAAKALAPPKVDRALDVVAGVADTLAEALASGSAADTSPAGDGLESVGEALKAARPVGRRGSPGARPAVDLSDKAMAAARHEGAVLLDAIDPIDPTAPTVAEALAGLTLMREAAVRVMGQAARLRAAAVHLETMAVETRDAVDRLLAAHTGAGATE